MGDVLATLETWLVRAIKDEERLDGESKQAQETVVECSKGWVFATLS